MIKASIRILTVLKITRERNQKWLGKVLVVLCDEIHEPIEFFFLYSEVTITNFLTQCFKIAILTFSALTVLKTMSGMKMKAKMKQRRKQNQVDKGKAT